MLPDEELREVLLGLALISAHGPWIRAVKEQYLRNDDPDPLWAGGPVKAGARFTPKGSFASLYLASDPFTALYEVEAIFDPLFRGVSPPLTLLTVEGIVENVLDLTDASNLRQLDTTYEELTDSWREAQYDHSVGQGPLPSTQRLGKMVYQMGTISGLLYRSAKNPKMAVNLVVFPDRLTLGRSAYLEVYDPTGIFRKRIP